MTTLDHARWVRLDPSSDRLYPLPVWQRESETRFTSGGLSVGLFDLPPHDPRFRFSGVCQAPLVAYPRTSFLLQPMGSAPVVADPMVAVLYEPDSVYYRHTIEETGAAEQDERRAWHDGDASLWIEAASSRPGSEAPAAGAGAPDTPDVKRIWPCLLTPTDAATFLLQDQLHSYLTSISAAHHDRALLEAASAQVIQRTLRSVEARSSAESGLPLLDAPEPGAPAESFRCHLARRHGSVPLREAMEAVGVSKTHLNRVLRRYLGWSPHRYGLELRLRLVLVRSSGVAPHRAPETLADLAREFGFASHSHLTARFREVFGVVPSWLREGTAEERLRALVGRSRCPGRST
jgi:AraC family transcriptional regulator